MKRFLLMAVITMIAAVALPAKSYAQAQKCIVTFHVCDRDTKEPLSDVTIVVVFSAGGYAATKTDQDGNASIEVPTNGNYSINISFLGYIMQVMFSLDVANMSHLDVELSPYMGN